MVFIDTAPRNQRFSLSCTILSANHLSLVVLHHFKCKSFTEDDVFSFSLKEMEGSLSLIGLKFPCTSQLFN